MTGCTFWPRCERTPTVEVTPTETYCRRHAIWVADRDTRQAVLARDGGRCRNCGAEGNSLDWAHIRGRGAHPTLRYDLDNAMMLCRRCHMRFGSGGVDGLTAFLRLVGDVFGLDHYNQLGLRSIARDRKGGGIDYAEVIRGARLALLTPAETVRYQRGTW